MQKNKNGSHKSILSCDRKSNQCIKSPYFVNKEGKPRSESVGPGGLIRIFAVCQYVKPYPVVL